MTERSELFLLVSAMWVTIGVFLCLVMGRRRYNALTWLVLGGVLGPLAVVLALVPRR